MQVHKVEYTHQDTLMEGLIFHENKVKPHAPLILIYHAWAGRDDFVQEKAQRLAKMGYIAAAMDVYGKGILGRSPAENASLMEPLMQDRALLRARLQMGYGAVCSFLGSESRPKAAMGYCFGGLCALDLARSGADLDGVVSFHGLLKADPKLDSRCKAKVLIFHGHDDPMVDPGSVLDFETEMTAACVDWQVHIFGGAMHAFTNPEAKSPALGTQYSLVADQRSWRVMGDFFEEVLK